MMKRAIWPVLLALALAVLVGCGSPPGAQNDDQASAPDKPPALPKKPVTLTVLDVSGDLISSKELIQNFAKANPKLVKDVKFLTADAPSLVGKVKAQQQSGNVDIDLVLTGNDGLAAGLKQDMWVKLLPNLKSALPDLDSTLTPVAKELQPIAQGYGVINRAGQNGPLLQYDPKQLPQPPKSPQALLAWAKAHPKKFIYARPSNSGPGRTFLMALPYLLGDKDPSDPVHGWSKTWAYLKELGKYVEYYPSGTADTVKMLGQGRVGLIPSITGFDIQGRSDGTLPPDSPIAEFDGQKWVADAHYMVIPRGGDKGRLAVTLALMKWMLRPDQQELTYATGNLTPVTASAKLDEAPAKGKAFMKKYGRPDLYPKLFANADVVKPVAPDAMVEAFDKWDREIGSKR
jgi:putative spermidine/putrescine transport system substrate-binding protein